METVGQILRAEREKKNLSVKDVEHATSIRALYITSIEADDYKVIPGEVYLKGFIRNYANFLGLNSAELVDLYRESQAKAAPEAVVTPQPAVVDESPKINLLSMISPKLAATAIILVAVIGIGFWAYGGQQSPSVPQKVQPPAEQAQQVPEAPAPAVPVKPANTKPVYVQAKFSEECWTQVTADGKRIYEGTPKKDESFTWEAQETLAIKAGNAGAMDVTWNGQPQGKLGKKGDVVTKTFTPQGSK